MGKSVNRMSIFSSILFLIMFFFQNEIVFSEDYYPDKSWRTSAPEAQGLNSDLLYQIPELIPGSDIAINSLLVIRHGYLVEEEYYYPYDETVPVQMHSCTKSVTSALIGIDLMSGHLGSVRQKVRDIFPDMVSNVDDPRFQAMTVEDLLTMRSGIDWPEGKVIYDSPETVMALLPRASNWIDFGLHRAMSSVPGEVYNYSSLNSHLLSGIIARTCGTNQGVFVEDRLFGPLGISNWHWGTDPQGLFCGYADLCLTPRDMARFAYLYLKHGMWKGQKILPDGWVGESTRMHVDFHNTYAENQKDDYKVSGYGYQIWLYKFGAYGAHGLFGQYIFVIPGKDMVVVVNSSLLESMDIWKRQTFVPVKILTDIIIKSIVSDGPIPQKPQHCSNHQDMLRQIRTGPLPMKHEKLPEIARRISGRTILLSEHNNLFHENRKKALSYALKFGPGDQCTMTIRYTDHRETFAVGLDGRFRRTDITKPFDVLFARGRWQDGSTFILDLRDPVEKQAITGLKFHFKKNKVFITYRNVSYDHEEKAEGTLE